MVCLFLLYNKVNQLYIYICSHISSLLHLPPPILPIPPLQVVTKHRADLPVLCGCFPLAIYFTFPTTHFKSKLAQCTGSLPTTITGSIHGGAMTVRSRGTGLAALSPVGTGPLTLGVQQGSPWGHTTPSSCQGTCSRPPAQKRLTSYYLPLHVGYGKACLKPLPKQNGLYKAQPRAGCFQFSVLVCQIHMLT